MPRPPLALPPALDEVLSRAEAKGHAAFLVGRAIPALLRGETPPEFELWVAATQDALRKLFPHAVTGVGSRWLLLPTAAGPIDLHGLTDASALEAALAPRDFRAHAIAYRASEARFVDPFAGFDDIAAKRLSAIGDPVANLAADPLRALRAIDLASTHALALDPALADALPSAAPALKALRGPRVRRELDALLLGPRAGDAVRRLREARIEAALVPGARDDAPFVIERLPPDLSLRWAAWLRDTAVVLLLRNLRMPRDRASCIERWLLRHPVDAGNAAALAGRARKLLHRETEDREPLLALRRAEIQPGDAEALAGFERLEEALARQREADDRAARRQSLAIDGSQVMDHLGCRPGAHVGQALRHLTEQITTDPGQNEPQRLLALLDAWWAERGPTTG
jgi:tRNA nucleotidyltransferase/poly(A) polymerase